MTRFQKIQKISSIIPFWSTFFVAIVTMYELKCRKASVKIWLYFILTFFLSGIAVYVLNAVIMTGQHLFLNVIASGLILAVANILFVDFQVVSAQEQHPRGKTINKVRGIIYSVVVIAVIVGVGVLLALLLAPSVDVEDINGRDNTKLAVIDIGELLSTDEHYSSFSSYLSQKGASTEIIGKLKKYDYDDIAFRCQKISGIKILQATKTSCNHMSLEINTELDSGNMEIVIIIDGQYYDHVSINQTSSIMLNDIADKTVVIKLAAESAKANIAIKRLLVGQGDGSVAS